MESLEVRKFVVTPPVNFASFQLDGRPNLYVHILLTTISLRGVGSFFKVGWQDQNDSTGSIKWVGKCPFSIKVK